MLAVARGLQEADDGLKSGRWLKGKLRLGDGGGPRQGHELSGKMLGVLGYGRIAQGVAKAASALGMRVMVYSRSIKPPREMAADDAVIASSPAELFGACTHIAVLCALNDETRGLVDRELLDMMPTTGADGTPCGAHVFNMARGGIVVEADAADALQAGTLASYCTDVFEKEPPAPDNPLLVCSGFHGTPHIGAATMEAQTRVGMQIARAVLAVLDGSVPADGIVSRPE